MPLGFASGKSRKFFPRTVLEKLSESVRIASRLNQAIGDFPCFSSRSLDLAAPQAGFWIYGFIAKFPALDLCSFER